MHESVSSVITLNLYTIDHYFADIKIITYINNEFIKLFTFKS